MATTTGSSGSLDAVLHLLDRQVVDADGLLVCKVDDVELTVFDDGVLGVTGLLVGPAALVPRYGDDGLGRLLHDYWRRLGTPAGRPRRPLPHRPRAGRAARQRAWSSTSAGTESWSARASAPIGSTTCCRCRCRTGRAPAGPGARRPAGARDHRSPGERIRVIGLVVGRGRPGLLLRLRPPARHGAVAGQPVSSAGCTGTRRTSPWRTWPSWTGTPG